MEMDRKQKPESAQDIINQEEVSVFQEKKQRKIKMFEIFRFAQTRDLLFMIIGTLGAIGVGAGLPAFALGGRIINQFQNSGNQLSQRTRDDLLFFIFLGLGVFAAGFCMRFFWIITGERQANKCRRQYVKALISQQIGWYDIHNQAHLASQFDRDTYSFQNGLGKTIAFIIYACSSIIAAFLYSFLTGWTLTLVMLPLLLVLGIGGGLARKTIAKKDQIQYETYLNAGGRASQVLMGIKTVKSLVGQEHQSKKYSDYLIKIKNQLRKYGFMMGGSLAMITSFTVFFYALGFWFGMNCILGEPNCPVEMTGEKYDVGDVVVVVFAFMTAGLNLSELGPSIEKITAGRQAAKRIFSVIDREPAVKNCENPKRIQNLQGLIEFRNVTFSYPENKSVKVLNNLSFKLQANSIGFVGESGCGKSTIMQLLMRFYDPDEGQIFIDHYNLKQLDLEWIRKQIGYVSQEPVLFAGSIRENLMMVNQQASTEEITEVLKNAEALQFIQNLQDGLDTFVGNCGNQLSGGQKQRIAISRALLKKPKILLLDEATSALDCRNEKLIQDSFNRLSNSIKTITIAHRVKTLRNVEMIFVMNKGQIQQKGSFSTLNRFKGIEIDDEEVEQNINGNNGGEIFHQVQTGQENREQEKQYTGSIYKRILKYSSKQKIVLILAVLFAFANGINYPICSIFIGDVLLALLNLMDQTDPQIIQENKEIVEINAIYFVVVGVLGFFCNCMRSGLFSWLGIEITYRIRCETYLKMLNLPVPWFDRPENNSGTLSTYLNSSCLKIQGLITGTISVFCQNFGIIGTGIFIGFYFEWRSALVTLGILPLMAIAGGLSEFFRTGLDDKSLEAYKQSSNIIMQCIVNIRTVTSFNLKNYFFNKYSEKLQKPEKFAVKKGIIIGLAYGISQFIFFTSFGLLFYLGAIFVENNDDIDPSDIFKSITALLFAGMAAGTTMLFLPDIGQAKSSSKKIFEILDTPTEADQQIKEKSLMKTEGIVGNIEFKNIDFKFQSRRDPVFSNFSILFGQGQKIGLVGKSGCGKSTLIQLLLRFYEIQKGQILIDGVDIKDYDLKYLRNCMGYIGQQPILFNDSFWENIQYNSKASKQEIEEAAKTSYSYDFIMNGNLPNQPVGNNGSGENIKKSKNQNQEQSNKETGFNKSVGFGGSHISGGQKQRIAIARAIIRKPQILLMDEATSALDNTNELAVQNNIDALMTERGIIEIAHRLNTLKNSDNIFVLEKGQMVEGGTFQDLMQLEGYLYKLQKGIQFV